MRAREFINSRLAEAELGRRKMLGYGLATAATAGSAGLLGTLLRRPTTPPSGTPRSTPTSPQSMVGRHIIDPREREQFLRDRAEAAGITGPELLKFLAQCSHETRGFRAMEEEPPPGVTRTQYFARYDPGSPKSQHRQAAQRLGNVRPGDGPLYHGRGFIQLTGRDNYRRVGRELGIPLEAEPDLAAEIGPAADIAIWWWMNKVRPGIKNWEGGRNLNRDVTRQINPGAGSKELKRREQEWRDYIARNK